MIKAAKAKVIAQYPPVGSSRHLRDST